MLQEPDNILFDSTPHAYPACSSEADQAGSCFPPLKEPLSSEQLAHHLVDNGLTASSIEELSRTLDMYGYYRLKGYCITLKEGKRFKKGVTLSDILEIESLNRNLAAYLLSAIATVEVSLRAQLVAVLGREYGSRALHCPQAFKDRRDFERLQATLERETQRAANSKKPLVLYNLEKYRRLPIWAEVENSSFGTLSRIFENLGDKKVATAIAKRFGTSWPYLQNWLRHLTQIRNICAHQDRLYNKLFTVNPRLYKEHRSLKANRLFPTFIVLFRLHEALDADRTNLLRQELGRIIDSHPTVDLKPIGFPANWREVLRIPDPDKRSLVRPRGRNGGHPLKDASVIQQALYQYDMRQGTAAEIAKRCGLSLSTLYKYINQRKEAQREHVVCEVVSLGE